MGDGRFEFWAGNCQQAVMIQVENLTFSYSGSKMPALDNISFEVRQGEFLAVLGNSEAGKSSLCYALTGYIPHFFTGEFSGQVLINGLNTVEHTLHEMVLHTGLIFQKPANQITGARFSVFEEVAFGLENLGIDRTEIRSRVSQLLELVGIADLGERSPFELSSGQQQRLALASILVMQPQVLVLDEPTSALDPDGGREIFGLVRSLCQSGITVVVVEHKLEWIAAYADRILVLRDGKVALQGTTREVLTSPRLAALEIYPLQYTQAALEAQKQGRWPAEMPLPITLAEAAAGFAAGWGAN